MKTPGTYTAKGMYKAERESTAGTRMELLNENSVVTQQNQLVFSCHKSSLCKTVCLPVLL